MSGPSAPGNRPRAVICHTVKGKGIPAAENNASWHHKSDLSEDVLQAIPGVTGVYFNRIPDHVLVDITSGAVKPADVVHRVNDAATSWQCKVELMQSCITADMPSASTAPHHSE